MTKKLHLVEEALKIQGREVVAKLKPEWDVCELMLSYYAPYLSGFEYVSTLLLCLSDVMSVLHEK